MATNEKNKNEEKKLLLQTSKAVLNPELQIRQAETKTKRSKIRI